MERSSTRSGCCRSVFRSASVRGGGKSARTTTLHGASTSTGTPTDNDLIYVSATKGSRAGFFNLVFFSANRAFKTESLISYEVGYKGTLLDGTMQLNSAVYLYDYENVETFGTGPSLFNPANTSTSVFSVPSAQIVGWDTDLDWLITDNITLGANFSYTRSEYTDHFTVNDPNDPNRPPSLFDPLNIPIDLDGKQMLQVPEMKGGVYAQYTLQMAERGQITFLANWSWIDQVYFSAFESKEDAAPSYQRTDLRATWISPSTAWTVAAFADNVFDEIGLRQVDHYGSTEETYLPIRFEYYFATDWFRSELQVRCVEITTISARFKQGASAPYLLCWATA